jgi:tetratricopeptide (TPR) repeat protein
MSREASAGRFKAALPILLRVAVLGLLMSSSALASGQPSTSARVRALRSFTQANKAYSRQAYAEAAALYEAAIQDDPALHPAYFFLANSYENLAANVRTDYAANVAALTKAAHYYSIAADTLSGSKAPEDKKLGRLALEYLVLIYGTQKLNDPEKARATAERMIALDPWNVGSYAVLATSYENAGDYDAAERTLLLAKVANPWDPLGYTNLAGFYNRQGQFGKAIAALEERASIEQTNPQAYYTIATYYWDKAYRDFKLSNAKKQEFVGKGLESIERALQLKPDYIEAFVYKGLLLRLQANLEPDPLRQQELIREADDLRDRAQQLRQTQPGALRPRR